MKYNFHQVVSMLMVSLCYCLPIGLLQAQSPTLSVGANRQLDAGTNRLNLGSNFNLVVDGELSGSQVNGLRTKASKTMLGVAETSTLSTNVSGTVFYQWQRSNTLNGFYSNIASATNATYEANTSGFYRALVTAIGNFSQTTEPVQINAVSADDFVTTWSNTNGTFSQLQFNALTTGPVNYSYTTNLGKTGSGSFSSATINDGVTLALGNTIAQNEVLTLVMEPTNLRKVQLGRLAIANSATRTFLSNVNQWGNTAWTGMDSTFVNCTNLNISATDVPNLANATSLQFMFSACSALNGPANIGAWDVSTITNMSYMFRNASAFNQPIGTWNTAAVTNMSGMFFNATAFNQNISTWNTAAVTNMEGMFTFASTFNQPIGTWNTAAVTNMGGMFQFAPVFNQAIGSWNTEAVTLMTGMFNGAIAFNQDISGWNTDAVTNMSSMFNGTPAFNQAIGTWNTAAVTNMSNMFQDATAFNQVISGWHTEAVTNMSSMFNGATSFNQDISTWNTAAVTDMGSMFRRASAFNQDISTWNTSAVTRFSSMFRDATAFNQPIGTWNVSLAISLEEMFFNATAFNQNLGAWTFNNTAIIEYMLENSGINCQNYSSTLVGWANNPSTPNALSLLDVSTTYGTDAVAARNTLVSSKGWEIFDQGVNAGTCLPTPTLGVIPNQAVCDGDTIMDIAITLGVVTDATLSATDNSATINPTYTFSGSGANRTLTIATARGQTGAITVTVTATSSDGTMATTTFLLELGNKSPAPHNALNFDGLNDVVDISLPSIFNNINTQDFSIETWAKPNSNVFSRLLFAQSNTNQFASISIGSNNQIYFYIDDTQGQISVRTEVSIPNNEWTHIVCTWQANSNTLLIYLNGELASTIPGGTSSTGANNSLTLGSRTNGAQFFRGELDELRIWDKTLTAEEIAERMSQELCSPFPANLIRYYKFNQGTAGGNNSDQMSLIESTSVSNNGVLNNFSLTGTTSNFVSAGIPSFSAGCLSPSYSSCNAAPIFNPTALANDTICRVMTSVNLPPRNVMVSDPDGSIVSTVVSSSNPSLISVMNTGTMTEVNLALTQQGNQSGTATIKIVSTDNLGAKDSVSFVIQVNSVSAGFSQTNVACFGESTGSMSVTPTGGTAPYSYSWTQGGSPLSETTASITNKPAGSYSVVIQDQFMCQTVVNFTLQQPAAALSLSTTKTDIVCEGDMTGVATVIPTGGTAGYQYAWSHSQAATSASVNDLGEGTYTVTVTDVNGCSATASVDINQVDTVAPIQNCKESYTLTLIDAQPATISLSELLNAASTDNCGILSEVADNDLAFNCTEPTSQLITITTTDVNGNSSVCSVTVNVEGCNRIEIRGNNVAIPNGTTTTNTADNTDFGIVVTNGSKQLTFQAVNISNTFAVNLTGNPRVTTDNPLFVVSTQPNASIPIGISRNFRIRFDATAIGVHEATVTILTDDPNNLNYTFRVRAEVLASEMEVRGNDRVIANNDMSPEFPDLTNFGNSVVGFGKTVWFYAHNEGAGQLNLPSTPKVRITGPGASHYSVTQDLPTNINSGVNRAFRIRYQPTSLGTHQATIEISNNDLETGGTYRFAIVGTGVSTVNGKKAKDEELGWMLGEVEGEWTTDRTEEEEEESETTKIYPNPSYERSYVELGGYALGSELSLRLLDAVGRLVWSKEVVVSQSREVIEIPLDGLSSGVYQLVEENRQIVPQQVIKVE